MRLHKWVASALKVATSWIPGVGTAVEEGLEHWKSEQERRSLIAGLLDTQEQTWRPDASPAALLRADFGVVPFHGREAELQDLARWCDTDMSLALRLYTAPGGFGKTRLMRHLVRLRGAAGWDAGVLPEILPGEQPLSVLLAEGGKPLLLVLDYAESRRSHIEAVVTAARDAARSRVRVILLARAEGDWWHELKRAANGVGDFFQGPSVEGPIPLLPLTSSIEARRFSYQSAIHAFAKILGKTHSALRTVPALDHEDFERVLLVHAAALAAVEGEQVPSHGLLDWLLTREEAGIDRVREKQAGLGPEIQRAIHHAAALLTLAQGSDSRDETVEIISRTPSLQDQPRARRDQIAEILHVLYQGRKWCDGVEPDLVGEHLVERHLRDNPILLDAAFGTDVPAARLEAGLTVLNRLAQRRPARRSLLEAVIETRHRHLAIPAVRVAVTGGDPIGLVLADVLARVPDPEIAREVEVSLPYPTTSLREVAAQVQETLWRELRAGEADPVELACRSSLRATRLADVGRPEDALQAIREAVEIGRALAIARPDASRSYLALTLNNLASGLVVVGQREEALEAISEAVEIYRALSEAEPHASRSYLATSLNNLSNALAGVGRREEALEAIHEAAEIYRNLADAQPGAFRPDLALSLNNISIRLGSVGRREDALEAIQEAVAIRRALAEARPDAFKPDLATSLNNLSGHLAAVGRREEALEAVREAVEIWRGLAGARPNVFRHSLGSSLNNLSNCLAAVGRREEALEAITEAVEIYRPLAEARPHAFRPDFASSLNNLSNWFAEAGWREGGLEVISEAVGIYRALAEAQPDAFRPDLAMSLNNFSHWLSAVGRRKEALDAIGEAVEIRRKLAEAWPDEFSHGLATSLGVYNRRLREMGQIVSALKAIGESIDILEPMFRRFPHAYADIMEAVADDYEHTVMEGGVEHDRERLRAIREILANFRRSGSADACTQDAESSC